jgi:hypothetical protein
LGIDRQLDSFRAVRRDIEASVLPLATSVDGRSFTFQASLYSLQLQVGSYATWPPFWPGRTLPPSTH